MTQNYLLQKKAELRSIQQNLILYKSLIKSLDEYKTKVIGVVKVATGPIKPKKKLNILMAGIVGFIMSFLLAFFLEYLEKIREKEKSILDVSGQES